MIVSPPPPLSYAGGIAEGLLRCARHHFFLCSSHFSAKNGRSKQETRRDDVIQILAIHSLHTTFSTTLIIQVNSLEALRVTFFQRTKDNSLPERRNVKFSFRENGDAPGSDSVEETTAGHRVAPGTETKPVRFFFFTMTNKTKKRRRRPIFFSWLAVKIQRAVSCHDGQGGNLCALADRVGRTVGCSIYLLFSL